MSYFSRFEASRFYPAEWQNALDYVLNRWLPKDRRRLHNLEHHIEMKALYVFTLSRHLVERSERLATTDGWKPVFVEAMMLLFPMIEFNGQARLGTQLGSDSDFGSGLDWLSAPNNLPQPARKSDHLNADEPLVIFDS
jgi:hypothetical protein